MIEERRDGSESGFSLIEVVIVMVIVFPILSGIAFTTKSVNDSIEANTRNADVTTYARRMASRVNNMIRLAQLSSLRVPAVQADVTAGRAVKVGDWIAPTELVWRPGVEFQSATGLQKLNGALTPATRRVVFLLGSGETDNGLDDDGDGLVDEGRIMLLQNATTMGVLENVEELNFELDGRMLKMRLTVARPSTDGPPYRFTSETRFFIRNN